MYSYLSLYFFSSIIYIPILKFSQLSSKFLRLHYPNEVSPYLAISKSSLFFNIKQVEVPTTNYNYLSISTTEKLLPSHNLQFSWYNHKTRDEIIETPRGYADFAYGFTRTVIRLFYRIRHKTSQIRVISVYIVVRLMF